MAVCTDMLKSLNRLLLTCCCLGLTAVAIAQPGSSSLSGLTGQQPRPTPLPLNEAFPYFVSELGENRYRITWTPASGHYLYRHAFAFGLAVGSAEDSTALEFRIPDGLSKSDQFFGDIEAYYDDVSAEIILPAPPAPGTTLIIEFQGCADWGFCYPPQRQGFELLP